MVIDVDDGDIFQGDEEEGEGYMFAGQGNVFVSTIESLSSLSHVYQNNCVLNILADEEDYEDVQIDHPEKDMTSIAKVPNMYEKVYGNSLQTHTC
jgi:hypothetical protein